MGSHVGWHPDAADFVMRRLDEAEAVTLQAIAAGASLDAGEGGEVIVLGTDSTIVPDEVEQTALAPLVCSCAQDGWHVSERDPAQVLFRIHNRREITRDCISRREAPAARFTDEPFLYILARGWKDHADWYHGWGGHDPDDDRTPEPPPGSEGSEPPAFDG
ncbi:DUF6221 family protein [Phytoactinopolyspora endophytica]|uniref:DUF6221 family protein n=1 Tax=Phytoactinopolyspora endophytica TaxID=1642495 RepID=UPI00101D6EE2|nr:DUF6221 family protein [Phytoactinopolyspora endophytica]